MRFIQFSMALPVLALVSANLDHHHAHQRQRRHDELVQLVARQRSSAGVLGPLLGGDDESSTVSQTTSDTSTTTSSSTRTPIVSTDEESTISPTPSPSTTSSLTPDTASSSVPSSLTSSSSSSIISSGGVASTSNSSSTSMSSTSSNTSTAESSTSSASGSVEPSMSLSVDAGGETVVVTVMQSIETERVSHTEAPAASSAAPTKKEDDGLAIPLGAIIGISVGAGVVILALIGLAVWRMKKRSVDDDDAIRWPELNRHGDSDAHHALPAVQTGKHGIETSPLERTTSNSSSIFAHSAAPAYDTAPVPMALNGSDFGGTTALDNDYYEKSQLGHDTHSAGGHGYELDHDYSSYPPVVQPHSSHPGVHGAQDPDSSDDEMRGGGRPTYGQYR